MSNEIRKDSAESILKINEIADLFHLLGDFSRLRIFLLIVEKDRSVTDIVKLTHLTQSNISHHLKLLRAKGLVISNRMGKSIIYKLNNNSLTNYQPILNSIYGIF